MDQRSRTRLSKFLSLVLRHAPGDIGLSLDQHGWAEVSELLSCAVAHGTSLTRPDLDEIVATSDKRRFAFDEAGTRIRASQGHSVQVDLKLEPRTPPDILYHGTGEQSVGSILATGLHKGERHHVHLSPSVEQAIAVGRRHGKPTVLAVDARKMHDAGIPLFMADNGVWLAEDVPPAYLTLLTEHTDE